MEEDKHKIRGGRGWGVGKSGREEENISLEKRLCPRVGRESLNWEEKKPFERAIGRPPRSLPLVCDAE